MNILMNFCYDDFDQIFIFHKPYKYSVQTNINLKICHPKSITSPSDKHIIGDVSVSHSPFLETNHRVC